MISTQPSYTLKTKLPAQYFFKYSPEVFETFQQDSSGDYINIAVDKALVLPQYVASSDLVTPKYLVQAKKIPVKLVSGFYMQFFVVKCLFSLELLC